MKSRSSLFLFAFAAVTFLADVKPILDTHCVECHSTGSTLDLSTYPFISNFESDQKTIVDMMLAKVGGSPAVMPPGNRPKLEATEITTLRNWRDQGLNYTVTH